MDTYCERTRIVCTYVYVPTYLIRFVQLLIVGSIHFIHSTGCICLQDALTSARWLYYTKNRCLCYINKLRTLRTKMLNISHSIYWLKLVVRKVFLKRYLRYKRNLSDINLLLVILNQWEYFRLSNAKQKCIKLIRHRYLLNTTKCLL